MKTPENYRLGVDRNALNLLQLLKVNRPDSASGFSWPQSLMEGCGPIFSPNSIFNIKQFNRLGIPAVALLFIAIAIFVANCKKTAIDTTTAESGGSTEPVLSKANDINYCDSLMDLVQFHNGVLQFQNTAHMNLVLQCLENQVESWNSAFDAQHGNLTDEAVDSIIDVTGFSEDQPLIDFENKFPSFTSMRKNVAGQIVTWLDNTTLDPATDPEEAPCVADDEELQSVLSIDGYAMIGDQLINFCGVSSNSGQGDEASDRGSCKSNGKSKKWVQYEGGKKKFKVKVAVRTQLIHTSLKAKVVSFKKKNNGKWKKYRTTLFVQNGGAALNLSCDFSNNVGNTKGEKKRRRLVTRFQIWAPFNAMHFVDNGAWGAARVGPDQIFDTVLLTF